MFPVEAMEGLDAAMTLATLLTLAAVMLSIILYTPWGVMILPPRRACSQTHERRMSWFSSCMATLAINWFLALATSCSEISADNDDLSWLAAALTTWSI